MKTRRSASAARRLDPDAIERVRSEAIPDVRDPDELHDVLLSLVATRPRDDWGEHFEALARAGRCFEVRAPALADVLWAATERRRELEALFPGARFLPDHPLPPSLARALEEADADGAAVTLVQGHLEISGPVTVDDLADATGLAGSSMLIALEALRGRGFAVSGRFETDRGEQWCARRLLARIHAYTRERRRAAVRPITQEEWQAFLESWWHAAPGTQRHGRAGLAEVIEQLQGFELPAGEWERIFAERVESYRPEWLDDLCLSGEVAWGRLSVLEPVRVDDGAADKPLGEAKTPSRRTPITFMLRRDLPWLLQAHRGDTAPAEPTAGSGREVLDALRRHGALFHSDLQATTNRLPTEVEEGLWDGVARGLLTADGWGAVRSLLNARTRFARRQQTRPRPGSRGRRGTWRQAVEGRWTLLPTAHAIDEVEELAETIAWQLLLRCGVVFRDVYLKERLAVPWREVLWALRRLEARGLIRGGHFVTGMTGEQFAEETTVPLLRPRRAGSAFAPPARAPVGARQRQPAGDSAAHFYRPVEGDRSEPGVDHDLDRQRLADSRRRELEKVVGQPPAAQAVSRRPVVSHDLSAEDELGVDRS
jgi:ATP-dependent Lhr-like helicase